MLAFAVGATVHAQIPQASSQRYLLDRWTVEDGLPNNALSGLMFGRDGYLWVGSLAGVWRFDGVRFTPALQSLPTAHVRTMFEDRRGALWVGIVGSGLVRIMNGATTIYAPSDLTGADVRVLAEDGAGRI